jgi:hypothetical protein
MRQLVGPVPINGIDLNLRYVPLPGQAAVSPKRKATSMWTALHKNPTTGAIEAAKVGGDIMFGFWGGAPGAFGIPQEALDARANDGIPLSGVDDLPWTRMARDYWVGSAAVLDAVKKIPTTGGGAGGGNTHDELVAAVKEGVVGAPVTMAGKVG